MLMQELQSNSHQSENNCLLKNSNRIRSSLLEYSSRESNKFLKSPTKVNSISMQKYIEQYDSQTIEIESQRYSSNNASLPLQDYLTKHNTSSIIRIPFGNYKKGNNTLTRNGSPKKKKIGKEKMTRFNNQFKTSPKEKINSLNMEQEQSVLDKSFDTIFSGKAKEEEDDKTKVKEAINYLRHLSSTLKSRKSISSITCKSSSLGFINANIDTLSIATQAAFLNKGKSARGSTVKSGSSSLSQTPSITKYNNVSRITNSSKANLVKSSSILETMKTYNNIKGPSIKDISEKSQTIAHTSSLFKIKLSSCNS